MRALDDLRFDYVFPLRYRYQHEVDNEFARNNYQLDGPVRGRIYEVDEDEWSSELSDDDDPVWRALYGRLPPWLRNPEDQEGAPEAVPNVHRSPVVGMKTIAAALETPIKAKKQKMLQKRGGCPAGC